uniref:Translation initiation factor eIF2B subunit delta n=1 Tax=Setaria digitata TaxID=48799 RepID=A0A915Q7J9_9BILA
MSGKNKKNAVPIQVNDAKEKLKKLKIDDKTNKPSSSLLDKGPKTVEELDKGPESRSREEIRMERKAKAAETKARKVDHISAAAAKAKETHMQSSNVTTKGKAVEKTLDEGRKCPASDVVGQQDVNSFKPMRDPGLPSGFRSSQPFKTVHFDLTAKDDGSEEGSSRQPSFCEIVTANIHPSFLEFASRCEAKHIVGIDAVCVGFVQSFKQFLSDYMVSPNQIMSRDLEQAVRQQLSCLTENGKHSFPMALGNLIKQLKKEIGQLPDSVSEEEGKMRLYHWLDDFVQQNFELALQAISSFCLKKMEKILSVLTYSWCPVVERIILDAHNDKLFFHVHVLDSPIENRGKQLVKTLCERKIPCSYGMLSSVGYLMRECHMVLLGCSAILSNGFVVAERGTSQIALVASASNIPVLVAAQTCKFVQSFSHGVHEVSALMGERKEVVPADLITALVTELRILPPSSAPAVLKAKQLAADS